MLSVINQNLKQYLSCSAIYFAMFAPKTGDCDRSSKVCLTTGRDLKALYPIIVWRGCLWRVIWLPAWLLTPKFWLATINVWPCLTLSKRSGSELYLNWFRMDVIRASSNPYWHRLAHVQSLYSLESRNTSQGCRETRRTWIGRIATGRQILSTNLSRKMGKLGISGLNR